MAGPLKDPRVAQALTNLRASNDFKVFLEYLNAYAAQEMKRLLGCTEPIDIGRAQGSLGVLQHIQDVYGSAPDTLKIIENSRRKHV